jgi:3-methyladenine DNA glycosylase AlkC
MADSATGAAPALKEIFDRARLRHIATETAAISPTFDAERFMELATENLDALGIMQRMRQTAVSLHATLPADFESAVAGPNTKTSMSAGLPAKVRGRDCLGRSTSSC